METEVVIDRPNASYGQFAYAVSKSFISSQIYALIIFVLFDSITDTAVPLWFRAVQIPIFSSLCYLIASLTPRRQVSKSSYGLRGWSNLSVDTEPKLVLALLCWPIFLIWLLSWPARKVVGVIRNHRENVYTDE